MKDWDFMLKWTTALVPSYTRPLMPEYERRVNQEARLGIVEEKWRIIFQQEPRSSLFPAEYYTAELRKHLDTADRVHADLTSLPEGEEALATPQATPVNISSLLRRLKTDLKVSFVRFVEDFVSRDLGGIGLLLQTLEGIQKVQGSTGAPNNRKLQKKTLTDEHDCLSCLKFAARVQESVEALVLHPGGLTTVATCLMSSFSKSRALSLEVLTQATTAQGGNIRVLEAFTEFKFAFGESTRFKMLVNMLSNTGYNLVTFQLAALTFLNRLLETTSSPNMRVYLQQELENAGLDINQIERNIETSDKDERLETVKHANMLSISTDSLATMRLGSTDDITDNVAELRAEIEKWRSRYLDVELIADKLLKVNRDNQQIRFDLGKIQSNIKNVEDEKTMLFRSEKKLRSECEQLRLRLHELEEQLTQKQASRRQADARQTHAHIIYDDRELNEPPPAFKPRPPSRQPARALSSSSRLLEMASRRPDKGSGRSVSLSRAYLTKDVGSPTPLTTSTPCLNAHRLGASLASLPSLLTKVDIRINGQVVEFDPASIGEVTGASEVAGSSEVVTGSSESVESKEVGVTGSSKVTGSSAVGVTEPGGVTVEEDRPLMFNKNDIGLYVPCYQPDDPCMPRRHGNKRSSIRDDDDIGSDGDDSRHVGSAHDDSNHDDSSVDSGCHDGSPTSSFQRKVKGDGKVTRGQLEVTALHMFDVRECGGGSKSPGSRQGSSEGRPSSSVLAEELGVIESAFEGIDQDQLAFI